MNDRSPRERAFRTSITDQVMFALRRAIRAIDLYSRYLIGRWGLTGPQLYVLKELSQDEGISVSQLTRAVHLSQPTVTGILDRLERRGLIHRHRSETDKRRVVVWLTEGGREILSHAPQLLQESFTRKFNELEDWEQTQILSALQRVVSMMEAEHVQVPQVVSTAPIDTALEHAEALYDRQSQTASPAACEPEVQVPKRKSGPKSTDAGSLTPKEERF